MLALQNIVQPWEMRVSAIWGHVSSSNLTKGFWWVLTGIIISYFCLLRRSQKQKMVQGHPAPQQKRLKHFPRGPSRGAGRWRKKLLVVFVSLGIIGSFWLFWHLNNDIMQRREEMLTNMCDERARMLQDQFNVSMNHVHALAILVSTFHHGKHPSAIDQVLYSIFPLHHLMQTYSWHDQWLMFFMSYICFRLVYLMWI